MKKAASKKTALKKKAPAVKFLANEKWKEIKLKKGTSTKRYAVSDKGRIVSFKEKMEEFLAADTINIPLEFKRNARRFLYYQLFKTSLPFGGFLEPSVRTTQTKLKSFELDDLTKAESLEVIKAGVLEGGDFLLGEVNKL